MTGRPGPRLLSLGLQRSVILGALALTAVASAWGMAVLTWSSVSPVQWAVLVTGTAGGAVGLFGCWRPPPWSAWVSAARRGNLPSSFGPPGWARGLLVGGMGLLALVSLGAPQATASWVPDWHLLFYAGCALILSQPRWPGLGGVIGPPVVLALLWNVTPASVLPFGLAVASGVGAYATLVLALLGIWLTWWFLQQRAVRADEQDFTRLRAVEREAEAAREIESWRAEVVRVHETTLNTIRWMLMPQQVNRVSLRDHLAQERLLHPRLIPPRTATVTTDDVLARVRTRSQVRAVLAVAPGCPALPIEPDCVGPLEAALVEIVRNAVGHGGATAMTVRGSLVGGQPVLRLHSDGAPPARGWLDAATPGLGVGRILTADLAAVGVTVDLDSGSPTSGAGTTYTLRLPAPVPATPRSVTPDRFDTRLSVGTAVLGLSVGALPYLWIVAVASGAAGLIGLASYAVSLVSYPITLSRGTRASPPSGLGAYALAITAGLCPWWFTLGLRTLCGDPVAVAAGTAIAQAIFLVWLVLTGRPRWLCAGLGLASVVLHSLPPVATCRPTGDAYLIIQLGVVLCISVVFTVAWIAGRTEQSLIEAGQADRRELAASRAERQLSDSLVSLVRRADALIGEVAWGAPFTPERRRELAALDGAIRVRIHVAGAQTGALWALAREIADGGLTAGVPVRVGLVRSSGQDEPIPVDLSTLLRELALDCRGEPPGVLMFDTGEEESLVVEVDRRQVQAWAAEWIGSGAACRGVGATRVYVDPIAERIPSRGAPPQARPAPRVAVSLVRPLTQDPPPIRPSVPS